MFKRLGWVLLALAVVAMPVVVDAAGGSGGGGSGGGGSTGISLRIAGPVTAIDYANCRIVIGYGYYSSGTAFYNSSTKISINNVTATIDDIQIGDAGDVRYDSVTRMASKISVTR